MATLRLLASGLHRRAQAILEDSSMDADRFDSLARSLTSLGSRRGALSALLSGALGLLGSRAEDSAAHNALRKCKKLKGDKKKTCLKKAKKHNAAHVVAAPPCTPDCQRKICGSNGCGGSCGSCADNEVCQTGRCVCVPACGGKECGDDGCGDSCGSCSDPLTCQGEGLCSCPLNVPEFCGGVCLPACDFARHPGTCECCLLDGMPCETSGECCGGTCGQEDQCRGIASGEQCTFDAQCASGDCRDSGLQAGKCV